LKLLEFTIRSKDIVWVRRNTGLKGRLIGSPV